MQYTVLKNNSTHSHELIPLNGQDRLRIIISLPVAALWKLRYKFCWPCFENAQNGLIVCPSWPNGIGAHLGRNRLWVRFLAGSDICPMVIEPTITRVPSRFCGYIIICMAWHKNWFETKNVRQELYDQISHLVEEKIFLDHVVQDPHVGWLSLLTDVPFLLKMTQIII